MSDPKAHHVVPRCILKNFTDDSGMLHCYDKKTKTYYATNPYKAFRRKHMYAYTNRDGTRSFFLEQWLGHLEDGFCRLADRLLRAARGSTRKQRVAVELSAQELDVARTFCFLQFIRTPAKLRDAREYLDSEFDDVVQEAIEHSERLGNQVSQEERERLQFLRNEPNFHNNQWIRSFFEAFGGDGYKAMLSKGLAFGVIKYPRQHAFVIGDNPVIQAFPGGITLSHPNAEIIMPIASNVALTLAETSKCKRIWLYNRKIREFNQYIFKHSDAIASRSEAITKSLSASLQ